MILSAAYVDGDVVGEMQLPSKDFDGTVLTGLNDAYVTACFANPDGTFPTDSLGGQEATDAFGRFQVAVTQAQGEASEVIPFSFPQPGLAGGGVLHLVAFVSDGVTT
jgi:hypothetical protein